LTFTFERADEARFAASQQAAHFLAEMRRLARTFVELVALADGPEWREYRATLAA
jgi:hypothetical protein